MYLHSRSPNRGILPEKIRRTIWIIGFCALLADWYFRFSLKKELVWGLTSTNILATSIVALSMAHIYLARHYLNTPWKQALWLGYGLFWVGLLLYVRLIKPLLLLRKPYVVEQVKPERGSAWTLTVSPEGHQGFRFMPGQFAWIIAGSSPFAEAEHPFSFSSSACHPEQLSFTIKEVGDFTGTIKELKPGQRVYVDGPFGHFTIDRQAHARQFVFIAGGVGITPFISMLRSMAERGDQRPVTLFYASKDWESVIFREELEALKPLLNLTLVYVLESPPADWTGESGYLNQAMLSRYLLQPWERNAIEVFLCGPPPMMNAVEKVLLELGVSLGDIHAERFNLV